jgi:hypothetical protein
VLCARLASATRPLDAIWTVTHSSAAIVYTPIAMGWAANLQGWIMQVAASTGSILLGMLLTSLLRRVAVHWFLRQQ